VKYHHHPPRSKRNHNILFKSFFRLFVLLGVLFYIGFSLITFFLAQDANLSLEKILSPRFFGLVILIPLALFILIGIIGRLSFRQVGNPVIDILNAIDEVAKGNLNIQIDESGARYFRALAHSLNHMISELAAQGLGIILISSDLPEIMAMSDRILVMREGRMMGLFSRSEATQESIMTAAMGRENTVAERQR
jgi:methyl-accepting chemotaxis protein